VLTDCYSSYSVYTYDLPEGHGPSVYLSLFSRSPAALHRTRQYFPETDASLYNFVVGYLKFRKKLSFMTESFQKSCFVFQQSKIRQGNA